jgi:hypothetical protein
MTSKAGKVGVMKLNGAVTNEQNGSSNTGSNTGAGSGSSGNIRTSNHNCDDRRRLLIRPVDVLKTGRAYCFLVEKGKHQVVCQAKDEWAFCKWLLALEQGGQVMKHGQQQLESPSASANNSGSGGNETNNSVNSTVAETCEADGSLAADSATGDSSSTASCMTNSSDTSTVIKCEPPFWSLPPHLLLIPYATGSWAVAVQSFYGQLQLRIESLLQDGDGRGEGVRCATFVERYHTKYYPLVMQYQRHHQQQHEQAHQQKELHYQKQNSRRQTHGGRPRLISRGVFADSNDANSPITSQSHSM